AEVFETVDARVEIAAAVLGGLDLERCVGRIAQQADGLDPVLELREREIADPLKALRLENREVEFSWLGGAAPALVDQEGRLAVVFFQLSRWFAIFLAEGRAT